MQELRQIYWQFRSALLDPDIYRTLFWDLPRAAILRWLGSITHVDDVRVRLGPYCSLKLAIEMIANRYESNERSLLDDCLGDGDVVLDLGTGIGVIAVLCARRLGSDRVFTFEANPALVAVAEETFRLNGVAPRIQNCVLGAAEGTTTFHVEKHFWSSSTLQRSKTAHTITLPLRRFETAIAEIRPSVLIVDIEGGEASLFDGVELEGVRRIMIELHPHVIGVPRTQHVREVLRDAGYAVVRELSGGNNVLFERLASASTRRRDRAPLAQPADP